MRQKVAADLGEIPQDTTALTWVTDFPMFEWCAPAGVLLPSSSHCQALQTLLQTQLSNSNSVPVSSCTVTECQTHHPAGFPPCCFSFKTLAGWDLQIGSNRKPTGWRISAMPGSVVSNNYKRRTVPSKQRQDSMCLNGHQVLHQFNLHSAARSGNHVRSRRQRTRNTH